MIKDWFDSFSGNITRRVTNPFLGTFAVVFLAYYWEPIYAIFTFDEGTSLSARLDFLNNYFGSFNFWVLLELIGITFFALLLTYILLSISYLISNTYSKRVVPYILGKIDKSTIVSREVYDRTQDLVDAYSNKYSEEREKVIQLQTDLENLRREMSKRSKTFKSEQESVESQESNSEKLFKLAYNDLAEAGVLTDFLRSVSSEDLEKGINFTYNSTANLLAEYNFLELKNATYDKDELYSYDKSYLTSLGVSFYQYAMDKYSEFN